MQIHDWKKAPGGLFHHFHQQWSVAICNALNSGLLPKGYFTLVEQHAGEAVPDLLTLQRQERSERPRRPSGGVALAEAPPKTKFVNHGSELEVYAAKANKLAIRDSLGELVAVIEIVSPGNKHSKLAIRKFVEKSVELIRFGIHLLVIDLISPGPRDPQGLHQLIWAELESEDFRLPRGKPLTLASYCCRDPQTAFIDPVAIGGKLPDMPVFIDSGTYVPVPLAETYAVSWNVCPAEFREDVLESQKWPWVQRPFRFPTNVLQLKETEMTTLLQEAFAAAEKLPPDEQDVLASRLLAELADEDSFDRTIAQAAHKLAGMANAALAEHRTGLTRDLDEQP